MLLGGPAVLALIEATGVIERSAQGFLVWGTVWLLLFVVAMAHAFGRPR